jgi:hypothetical protein
LWLVMLLSGCGKRASEDSVVLQYRISPQPPRVGPATVSIDLVNTSKAPVAGAHLKLEAYMNHPGMAPILGDLTETSQGRYDGHLNFTMAGDWTIVVRGVAADGIRIEKEVKVPDVRPD